MQNQCKLGKREQRKGKNNKRKSNKERQLKSCRQAAILSAAAVSCALLLPGCSSDLQTDETMVVPKGQQETGIPEADNQTSGKSTLGSVAQQVMAPAAFQAEAELGPVRVKADAKITIPDVPGIKTKKVTARVFTQEDYEAVNQALLDGGTLWDRDYDAMEDSHGFTKQELLDKIEYLEEEKERGVAGDEPYGDKETTLNEQIGHFREMAELAPEGAVIKEVPEEVNFDEAVSDSYGNCLSGYVTLDGQDYFVDLNNNLLLEDMLYTTFFIEKVPRMSEWEWQVADLSLLETYPSIVEPDTAEALKGMKASPKDLQDRAQQLVQQIGMEEYALQGGEYCAFYEVTGEDMVTLGQAGYMVYFTRQEDEIPVIYTRSNGSMEGGSIWWPYEEMDFIYTDDGLVSFKWANPYEVEDLSAEYVFLMPFADIQNIFTEMILKKNQDIFNEEGDTVEIHVEEACLGYMRISDGTSGEGTLVPAWNFFGEKVFYNSAGEESHVRRYDYDSLLTINAMDGTVIDR